MFYRNKWWIAVLIWCVVIFLFSELSIFRGDHMAKVIKEAVGEVRVHAISLNVIVRMLAHIFLFGVLSALVWKPCNRDVGTTSGHSYSPFYMRSPTNGINPFSPDVQRLFGMLG